MKHSNPFKCHIEQNKSSKLPPSWFWGLFETKVLAAKMSSVSQSRVPEAANTCQHLHQDSKTTAWSRSNHPFNQQRRLLWTSCRTKPIIKQTTSCQDCLLRPILSPAPDLPLFNPKTHVSAPRWIEATGPCYRFPPPCPHFLDLSFSAFYCIAYLFCCCAGLGGLA